MDTDDWKIWVQITFASRPQDAFLPEISVHVQVRVISSRTGLQLRDTADAPTHRKDLARLKVLHSSISKNSQVRVFLIPQLSGSSAVLKSTRNLLSYFTSKSTPTLSIETNQVESVTTH